MELAWGVVTSAASPVEVRFAGDVVDTPIGWQPDGVTLATSDVVALGKLGTVDGWAVLAVLVATS